MTSPDPMLNVPEEPTPPEAPATSGVTDGKLDRAINLRDFLHGVGYVFRLQKRDLKREQREALRAARREEKQRHARQLAMTPRLVRMIMAGIACAALILVAQMVMAFKAAEEVTLPPAIYGLWTTTAPKYADRGFRITDQLVSFQTGSGVGSFVSYRIMRVTGDVKPDTSRYDIEYDHLDGMQTFSVEYIAGPSPTIRFPNQPEIRWKHGDGLVGAVVNSSR